MCVLVCVCTCVCVCVCVCVFVCVCTYACVVCGFACACMYMCSMCDVVNHITVVIYRAAISIIVHHVQMHSDIKLKIKTRDSDYTLYGQPIVTYQHSIISLYIPLGHPVGGVCM